MVRVEDRVGPVAVVDVPVEDQHALERRAPTLARRAATADVVEEAEAHRARRLGVVPGRAHARRSRSAAAARSSASTSATAPPAACTAASNVAGTAAVSMSIMPAAARAELLDEVDVRGRVHGEQLLARRVAAPRSTSHPNQSWRSISASSATIRSGRSGWPGTSWRERELVAQPDGPGHADTVRTRRHGTGPTSSSWAPAPPASTPRCPPRARARASRWSPRARWPRPRPTGPRAGSPPRSPTTTRPSCTSRTRSTPAAGSSAPRPRASWPRRRPRASATSRSSACTSTPTATATSRSGSRAGTRAAASRTPAAAPPAAGSCASSAPTSPSTPASTCSRAGAPARCARHDGRVAGARLDDGRTLAARAVILATGGAAALWSRTTNPPGSFGSGLLLARAAGADARRPRVRPVPPHRRHRHPRPRGLPRHRGAARRGRDAARRHGRALRRRARRRATTWPARSAAHGRDRPAPRPPRHARRRPRRFPNVVQALREAGLDPMTELVPVAPAAHYVMGGVVTDLDGRTGRRRPLRGRRVPPAPACTAPTGSPRTRSRSASSSAAAPRAPALDEPAPAERSRRPRPAEVGAAVARDAQGVWRARRPRARRRDASPPLLDDPHPLARLVAASALAREESRGAHPRTDFPRRDPDLDGRHTVTRHGEETAAFRPRGVDVTVHA